MPCRKSLPRADIHRRGERHQAELHRLLDLLDQVGLQGERVDELLGGGFRRSMRFWPEPEPRSLIEPQLSSTSATSSVFFRRISVLAAIAILSVPPPSPPSSMSVKIL